MDEMSINTPVTSDWQAGIKSGERFEFGQNWALFLLKLTEERIVAAERSLLAMLCMKSLKGQTFIDIGSGSGLFSLAARRLGAIVTSFDFDPDSFACTQDLKRRFFPNDANWTVLQGSVLDREFMLKFGKFDVVYSWGVLHHTGAMWEALANVAHHVKPGGSLYIAIYNDQGRASRRWTLVKRGYVGLPKALRWMMVLPSAIWLWGPTMIRDALRLQPLASWRNYDKQNARGMDAGRDLIDWIGGYPFEVAKPEEIFDFYRKRGFNLNRMATCAGGLGCNEFTFIRG